MKRNLRTKLLIAVGAGILLMQCKKFPEKTTDEKSAANLKTGAEVSTGPSKPNVLFIIVDDLRYWTIKKLWEEAGARGGANNTMPVTPHIDGLINESVTFTNAHSTSVECCPSRTSFLTGKYPHETGVYNNRDDWQSSTYIDKNTTLFAQFANNPNYLTYGAGKIFHCDPLSWYLGKPYLPTKQTYQGDRPFVPYTPVTGYEYKVIDTQYKDDIEGGASFASDTSKITEDAKAVFFSIERMKETKAYNLANPTAQKSFFVTCGLRRPHADLLVPKYYFDMYPNSVIKTPQILPDAAGMAALPQVAQDMAADHQPLLRSDDLISQNLAEWKRYLRAYMGCVSYMDYQVGRLINYVKDPANGIDGNTIIVLISDHGFHLGEKHHVRKSTLWEETTRVPIIWRVPGINPGQRCATSVDLMSVYPTLKAYCGLGGSPGGKNIKPLIESPTSGGDYFALTTTTSYGTAGNVRTMASVRLGTNRLTQYKQDASLEELYQQANDPWEANNLNNLNPALEPGWSITLRSKLPASFKPEVATGIDCD